MSEVLPEAAVATLACIADRVFPPGGGCAGGRELGVVPYVLGQLAGPWGQGEKMYRREPFVAAPHPGHGWQSGLTPAEAFALGLAAVDEHAAREHGSPFAGLRPDRQDTVLADLERGVVATPAGLDPAQFFTLLLETCVEGVFSDPRYGGNRNGEAWAWIGFPGPGEHAGTAVDLAPAQADEELP
ncbi:MAG TPA: gluconate 2-dehydrogenase subunit 3 family protein [Streptosporangiaceae bacterium]